ncbi:MAG: RluA family pseudouridine synthase [Clostridia bacterium]|jgi:23S rRNA pseudouridine1911/1915/1917 synthase|nr:RluA family pseudouridine synthase [Clostridia bacterium]
MENYHRYHFQVEANINNTTLKKYLSSKGFSAKLIKRIKTKGSFWVNGIEKTIIAEIKAGDRLVIDFGKEEPEINPENIPLKIIYEDDDLLVVNKDPFQVVHPTRRHLSGTLANAATYHFLQKGIMAKARFINRLDRDTSGIILISKNTYAHEFIQRQLKSQQVKKTYWALVEGHLKFRNGVIDAPIGRPCPFSIVRSVMEGGQEAITNYKVLKEFSNLSLLELAPLTGRTHQLRVHLAYIGHPIIGDSLYKETENPLLNRQALHAKKIEFVHPRTKKKLIITAELSADILDLVHR